MTGDVQGDRLINLRVIPQAEAAKDALLFNFAETPIGGKPAMVLKVTNHFSRPLKYHAGMQLLGHRGVTPTSSCPVRAGLLAFETWPHPIVFMLVKDPTFTDPKSPGPCAN